MKLRLKPWNSLNPSLQHLKTRQRQKTKHHLYSISKYTISILAFGLISTSSYGFIPFPTAIPFPLATNCPKLIIGQWSYSHALYKGTAQPKRDPDLFLDYSFMSDGSSSLRWHNTRTGLYCARKGEYSVVDDTLHEKVTSLDPKNSITCGNDPDMRLNTETATPISFEKEQLHLHLSIGAEPFIYVWTKPKP